jgi:hypothetical protein
MISSLEEDLGMEKLMLGACGMWVPESLGADGYVAELIPL